MYGLLLSSLELLHQGGRSWRVPFNLTCSTVTRMKQQPVCLLLSASFACGNWVPTVESCPRFSLEILEELVKNIITMHSLPTALNFFISYDYLPGPLSTFLSLRILIMPLSPLPWVWILQVPMKACRIKWATLLVMSDQCRFPCWESMDCEEA